MIVGMSKFPAKPLSTLCESIDYGVSTSANYNSASGLKFLRITDITDIGVNWEKVPFCNISNKEEKTALLCHGDIVVARTGGTVGKSFLVETPPRAVNASYLLRIRVIKERILPEYLSLFMGSDTYWSQLMEAARGAAQPNVNATTLATIMVPVPKITDQHCISVHLKAQLVVIEEARIAAQLQLNELTNLANAIIHQSVEHSETAPAKLGDVLDEVKKGIGKTWADYPVLGATRAGLALAKEPVGKSPERYKPVLHGTVFYNPMRIMIGSIAMVDELETPGITSPDYVALRGKPGLVDSRWFYYWLRSPYGVSCIASLARGAVRERMLFNRLAEGSIELPPYDVQVAAAKALAELKPMRTGIEKQLAEINLLPGKILAKAFEIEA